MLPAGCSAGGGRWRGLFCDTALRRSMAGTAVRVLRKGKACQIARGTSPWQESAHHHILWQRRQAYGERTRSLSLVQHRQEAGRAVALKFASSEVAAVFSRLIADAQQPNALAAPGPGGTGLSDFSRKTDEASAEVYFRYYGMLQHQQVCMHASQPQHDCCRCLESVVDMPPWTSLDQQALCVLQNMLQDYIRTGVDLWYGTLLGCTNCTWCSKSSVP